MSVIHWADDDKTIIVWKIVEGDMPQAILDATRQFAAMLAGVDHPTYAVIDLLEFITVPAESLTMFPQMARLLPPENKRPKIIAIVSARKNVNTLVDLFARVYPGYQERFVSFTSLDQAFAHIRARMVG